MSLDIDIGPNSFNLTYNYSYMYIWDAMPEGLRTISGMKAVQAQPLLKALRERVEQNIGAFTGLEKEKCNGWGTVSSFYSSVNDMIFDCYLFPQEIIKVS